MIVRLRLVLIALSVSAMCGCAEPPSVEGEWEGVATTVSGPGIYYTITLRDVEGAEVSGSGGVSFYSRSGASADSILHVDVQGTYRHPELALTISGPFPSAEQEGAADFVGTISPDGMKIEGTLSSPVTGEVDLDFKRTERE